MALKIADWKEVADAFKNLVLKKGIKAHLCQLKYLFFQNVCHPSYVPWSIFVHGAFEITAPLPDFGCSKLILYWFTIFLGKKRNRIITSCAARPFSNSLLIFCFSWTTLLSCSLLCIFPDFLVEVCADYASFFLVTSWLSNQFAHMWGSVFLVQMLTTGAENQHLT